MRFHLEPVNLLVLHVLLLLLLSSVSAVAKRTMPAMGGLQMLVLMLASVILLVRSVRLVIGVG